jgi:NADH-quinone oxidoreductase subunit C
MADDQHDPPTPPTPPRAAGDAGSPKGDAPGEGAAAAPKPPPKAPPRPPARTADGAAAAAPKAEHKPAAPAPPAGPVDPPPPEGQALPAYLVALQAALPGAVTQVSFWVGDWTIIVPADRLLDVARYLHDTPGASFDFCSDVTAVDWPPRAQRFDVVYCLCSVREKHRVRIKVRAAEDEPVPSMTGIWPAANWLEREVYDLFGVNFTGHPDRRRILMPDEWQGHPQRKDYPLEGPGELLMESPLDWLRLRNAQDTADIE